jgi:prophage maintenance system killer protein
MDDLSVGQIITLHDGISARNGGDPRLISEGNLHQVVFHANLIPAVVPRAAFVFYSLIAYPAFREGNGTTARELSTRILEHGGYEIGVADREELTRLELGINAFTVEPEEIEDWFGSHARKRP